MVLGLIPKHGKCFFSCTALLDMVPSKGNCGQGFVTRIFYIVFLCMVEIKVSRPVIYVPTLVGTCMSVDTYMHEQSDS